MSLASPLLAWARVAYNPEYADKVFGALYLTPEQAPEAGWSQSDAVQAATDLSMLRDAIACPNRLHVAVFNADGSAYDTKEFFGLAAATAGLEDIRKAGRIAVPIAGDAPLCKAPSGSDQDAALSRDLPLAIDELLVRIGRAEQGGETPPTINPIVLPAITLAAIIVTGAALAVIGVAAVWRYLDPELRRDVAIVKQAADSYATRLQTFQQTGTMPPPSDVETAAMPTIGGLAKERSKTDWLTGGAIAGGIALGLTVVGVISHMGDRRAAA